MKIFCISQARMGSTRLPDKVLKKIQGKSLLEYHALRIAQAKKVDLHIIATTDLPQDQAIVDFCKKHNMNYFCGDSINVLSRYYHTAKAYNVQSNDLIIRVTSDCPIIAPELIDDLVKQHISNNLQKVRDTISNIDTISSYPRGFDAEIFSMKALTNAFLNASTEFQLEHVTPYLYQETKVINQLSIKRSIPEGTEQQPDLRLCVDEKNDFILIEQIVETFPSNIINATAEDIILFLQQHPAIAKINQDVKQKTH